MERSIIVLVRLLVDLLDLFDWQSHRKDQRLILKFFCEIFITLGLLEVMLSQSPGGPKARHLR